jgi:hypothetical protein
MQYPDVCGRVLIFSCSLPEPFPVYIDHPNTFRAVEFGMALLFFTFFCVNIVQLVDEKSLSLVVITPRYVLGLCFKFQRETYRETTQFWLRLS